MTNTSIPLDPAFASRRAGYSVSGYHFVKRAFDLSVSVILLLLLFPLFVMVALLIKIDSPGPVLFRQARVGGKRYRRDRRTTHWGPGEFQLYKFRSMAADADPRPHQEHVRKYVAGELCGQPASGEAEFKLTDDERVTSAGRFLRRTSLDELPQLLNVLRGDMSLVGPRPVPLYEAAHYEPNHFLRFAVPGGMTGLWQVAGRGDVSFAGMIDLDISYVEQRSICLDMKILFLTIPALIRRKGAA